MLSTEEMATRNLPLNIQESLSDALGVWQFLEGARLEMYAKNFLAQGFDSMNVVRMMDDKDLEDCGVSRGHIKKIRMSLSGNFDEQTVPRAGILAWMQGRELRFFSSFDGLGG